MVKTVLLYLCFSGFLLQADAQVNLTLQVPPTGVVQKNQLWNIVLVNTGNEILTVSVGLSLLNAVDNRPVMTALSKTILLGKGARQLGTNDVAPVLYNYLSALFNVDRSPNGFLPIGNYKACYTVYQMKSTQSVLAEDCIPVEVLPLSPPLLYNPEDGSTVSTPYPQFSWLPPVPLSLFSNLSYDLLVVEQLPGQSSNDAIQQNIPVYNTSNIKGLFINYPASFKSLDTGHLYAWKVIAKNENEFTAQSDVWTFRIGKTTLSRVLPLNGDAFVKLKRGTGTGYIQCRGHLLFEYDNDAGDTLIRYNIVDAGEGKGVAVKTGSTAVQRGQNFIEMDLTHDEKLAPGKLYLLELLNSRKEIWGTRFTYSNAESVE